MRKVVKIDCYRENKYSSFEYCKIKRIWLIFYYYIKCKLFMSFGFVRGVVNEECERVVIIYRFVDILK